MGNAKRRVFWKASSSREIYDDFFGGGFNPLEVVGTTMNVMSRIGGKLAPSLTRQNLVTTYRARGIWGMPPAVAYIWLIVGSVIASFASIFVPLAAFIVVAPWAKWYAASLGVKLSVGDGKDAFKASVWNQRRSVLYLIVLVFYAALGIGVLVQMLSGNGIGSSTAIPTAIFFLGGAFYFWVWFALVRTSINEFVAGSNNNATDAQVFYGALAGALGTGFKVEEITSYNFQWVGHGFVINPVPEKLIRPNMQPDIRARAEALLPEYELLGASAAEIRFIPVTQQELNRRQQMHASGGLLAGRRELDAFPAPTSNSVGGYFSEEDFE